MSEESQGGRRRHRIVILCGPGTVHKRTCATLLNADLNVAGICVANQKTVGVPISYLWRSIKKKGVLKTASRIFARFLYQIQNGRADHKIFRELYNESQYDEVIRRWHGPVHGTRDYSAPRTLAWIRSLEPDVLVVHSPYWVGKKVRDLAKTGIVLGGHPGITPVYRGSHSPFWALYFGRPQDVGGTVFLVGKGVDTGDVVQQCSIPIQAGDSYFTLGWRGMIRIAQMQAKVLEEFDHTGKIPRTKITVPPNSEFDNPTLAEYIRYRRRQQAVR